MQVYKAILDDHCAVALKVLNPADVGESAMQLVQFEREIEILKHCKHHAIVACLGAWLNPDGVRFQSKAYQSDNKTPKPSALLDAKCHAQLLLTQAI